MSPVLVSVGKTPPASPNTDYHQQQRAPIKTVIFCLPVNHCDPLVTDFEFIYFFG